MSILHVTSLEVRRSSCPLTSIQLGNCAPARWLYSLSARCTFGNIVCKSCTGAAAGECGADYCTYTTQNRFFGWSNFPVTKKGSEQVNESFCLMPHMGISSMQLSVLILTLINGLSVCTGFNRH